MSSLEKRVYNMGRLREKSINRHKISIKIKRKTL